MIGIGLYLIAVVFVLATLLRQSDLSLGGITIGMIGVALVVHYLPGRVSRNQLAMWVGFGLSALMIAAIRISGLGWGPALIATSLVVLAVIMAAGHQGYLQAVVAATIPATALVLTMVMANEGPAARIPIDIMLWSLAAWPALAIMTSGRRWTMTSSLGVVCVLVVIHRLLTEADATASLALIDVGTFDTDRREGLLAIGQTLLVIASVGPHLALSAARWRWTALFGLLAIIGPIILAFATGPWVNGWPLLIWYTTIPAIILLIVGIIGMLCTTRQPEQLADNAVRTMALGIGATATLLLPIAHNQSSRSDLVSAVSTAVSPLAWGLGLALVLSITGLVARRNDTGLNTTTLFRLKVRPRFRTSMLAFGRKLTLNLHAEAHKWWAPSGIVPIVVLAATWPAFSSLGSSAAIVPLLAVLAAVTGSLTRASLPLWTMIMALLLTVAAMSLGLPLSSAIAASAVGVAAAWPFVRWSSLNTSWAFCAGMLVLAILWPSLGGPTEQMMTVGLALGITALVTNAFAATGARWLLLATTAGWLLLFMAQWIPEHDPYFPLLLKGNRLLPEIGHLFIRLPVLAIILATLWVSRHRTVNPEWKSPPLQRLFMGLVGVLAAAVWAIDFGDNILTGLLAWLILVLMVRPVVRELSDSRGIDDREPFVDATSFVVAILIVSAGRCASLVRATSNDMAGSGLVEPGSMGIILIDAIRDTVSLAVATGVLMAISGLAHHSRIVSAGREAIGVLRTGIYRATMVVTKRQT